MNEDFEYAFALSLVHEGGWSDHPADRGGRTKYGVTEAEFKRCLDAKLITDISNISELTRDHAQKIYKKYYWDALHLDTLDSRNICTEIFDTAINMGVSGAVKIAQKALKFFGEDVGVDGVMGAKTLDALTKWIKKDELALFICLNGFQFEMYVKIIERDPSQLVFARGWTRRIQQYVRV